MECDCNLSGSLGPEGRVYQHSKRRSESVLDGYRGANCLKALHWAMALGKYSKQDQRSSCRRGKVGDDGETQACSTPISSGHGPLANKGLLKLRRRYKYNF